MILIGWLKNKTHLLTAAVGAGTNYEMIVKCYFGTGTDGSEIVNGEAVGKVYLNSLCNSDFSDVRFGSSDGVSLYSQKRVSYVASSYAIFIFKVAESLGVNESIIVYYGNPAAVDVSSDLAAESVLSGLVGAWNFDASDIEINPIVVCDDNQAAFWTNDSPRMVVSNEPANKLHGVDSARIVCVNEVNFGGIYHTYGGAQDWSTKNRLSFDFYGANTGFSFCITLWYGSVSHQFYTTLIDNFVGWKHFSIPFSNFTVLAGSPAWSGITSIYVVVAQGSTSGTWYLDRMVVDVDTFCADSSGNGNHGTLIGANNGAITGATRVAGKYGYGLSFDGTDDYVTIPNNVSLNPPQISCFMWMKSSSVVTQRLVWKVNAFGISTIVTTGKFYATIYASGGHDSEQSAASVCDGNWHHVGFTYDGVTLLCYVDGAVSSTNTVNLPLDTSSSDLLLASQAAGSLFFNGLGDEVRIYNRVISPTEVTSLFNNVRVDAGLVGEWLFEEANGAVAYDTHLKTASGKYGDALNLDGLASYVAVPHTTALDAISSYTVACWINYITGQTDKTIIAKGNYPTDTIFDVHVYPTDKIDFCTSGSGLWENLEMVGTLSAGWHFIVCAWNGYQKWLYIDGVFNTMVIPTYAPANNTSDIHIGESGGLCYFNGNLDEVKVFTTALVPAQITALYNASPKAYATSPILYADLLLVPSSIYVRKWVVATQPAHNTWGTETSSWGLSRLTSLVVLPIVNNIMPRGGCNVEVFTQDGSVPILNVTSQTEDMLSLQGSICIPNQNDDLYLITNYLLPLIAMKGKAVTLYSPNALFDGEWLLRDYSFPKVAEGAFTRYRFTLNLSKGYAINEL